MSNQDGKIVNGVLYRRHANGGGWVAATAWVDDESWVGKNAIVGGHAVVTKSRITGSVIGPGARVTSSRVKAGSNIGAGSQVFKSHIEGTTLPPGITVNECSLVKSDVTTTYG